jgi:hypothetical protein
MERERERERENTSTTNVYHIVKTFHWRNRKNLSTTRKTTQWK